MATIKKLVGWSDEFALGLDGIDAQHKSLFELINKTWQAIVERAETARLMALLGDLESYTQAHFVAEEAFMQSTGFPDLAAHQALHHAFVARIAQEKAALAASGQLSLDLLHFLQDWLVDHIRVADKEYADFTARTNSAGSSVLGRFFKRFW